MKKSYLIAFESSCDDTAVAIIDADGRVLADVVHSQIAPHALYGGVVPEIASRHHLGRIAELTKQALQDAQISREDIGVVAATVAPGLIGALLVGAQFAKGFAQGLGVPFVGVHHIEGHVMAGANEADFPKGSFVALIASGGHSALYQVSVPFSIKLLGETRDDAAGEAFDKIARMLGLGYPGGKVIDELADKGDAARFPLPTALKMHTSYDFSFSGLKTAAKLLIAKLMKDGANIEGQLLYDVCASVRFAVVEALLRKAFLACRRLQIDNLVLGGGVAANSLLRSRAMQLGKDENIHVFLPAKNRCTDNAVMIALAAQRRVALGQFDALDVMVQSTREL